jgi:hypothetical protein
MANSSEYVPPKVWIWNKPSGGRFANINRPIAGPTHDKELPIGRHPLQLYSLGTPNGVKVTIMLEELLALGHSGAEYDAWLINIGKGEQFGSGFVTRCGTRGAEDGVRRASAATRTDPSFGPRQSVCEPRLPATAGATRNHRQHEPARKLLGQRGGRELLRHAQNGTGLSNPMEYPRPGTYRSI